MWLNRAHQCRRTSRRRHAACALSTCSRSASSAGWRGGEWHIVARGGTRATEWQWRGQRHPRRSCRRGRAPPEPPLEPPAKRPYVSPVPAVAGRYQRPDCRSPSPPACRGRVQSTLPWVRNPPPPHGIQRAPQQGGGSDRMGRRASVAQDSWG